MDQAIEKAICKLRDSIHSHYGKSMKIGAIVDHPKGYKVKVISGRLLDPIYGRLTNWWTWQRVKKDGTLGKIESGYGW